jgi:hypothetical protein
MAFTTTDTTATTQRLQISDANYVEFGSGTPVSNISVQGRNLLNGAKFANSTCPPYSLKRTTGTVTNVAAYSPVSVSTPGCKGMASGYSPGSSQVFVLPASGGAGVLVCTWGGTGNVTYGNI